MRRSPPRFESRPFGNENATEESEFALFQTSSFHFISSVFQVLTNFPGVKFSRTATKLGKEKQNPCVTYPRSPELLELGVSRGR